MGFKRSKAFSDVRANNEGINNKCMKKILLYLVSSIVNDPKKVEIEEKEEDEMINFTIKVADEDMGRIIGKQGKVIRAIRNVMKIPAIKQNKRINIGLVDKEKNP